MKIISFIEDEKVIEKILKHLGLWDLKVRLSPKVKVPSPLITQIPRFYFLPLPPIRTRVTR